MYDEFVRKASLLLGNLSSIQVSNKSVVLEREIYLCRSTRHGYILGHYKCRYKLIKFVNGNRATCK